MEWHAQRVPTAGRNGGESRNHGKRDKMPSVAFYPASFLAKTCLFLLLTNDAPSLALLVLQDKMTRKSDRTRSAGHSKTNAFAPRKKEKNSRLLLCSVLFFYFGNLVAVDCGLFVFQALGTVGHFFFEGFDKFFALGGYKEVE